MRQKLPLPLRLPPLPRITLRRSALMIPLLFWAVTRSKTVIAIIDTGAELSHEDLVDSLWINEAEQNGTDNVDDDNNGYIDDIYGVDFINNVPTPVPEDSSAPLHYEAPEDDSNTSHGTHVSGIIGMNQTMQSATPVSVTAQRS